MYVLHWLWKFYLLLFQGCVQLFWATNNFSYCLDWKMRALVRSVRHFRFALRHQACSYSSNFTRRKQLRHLNSGLACKQNNNAEIHRFLDHPTFTISRALAVDAVKVTNGGYLILYINSCVEWKIKLLKNMNSLFSCFMIICVWYFQSQMWTVRDLSLSMNGKLLQANLLMVTLARYTENVSSLCICNNFCVIMVHKLGIQLHFSWLNSKFNWE